MEGSRDRRRHRELAELSHSERRFDELCMSFDMAKKELQRIEREAKKKRLTGPETMWIPFSQEEKRAVDLLGKIRLSLLSEATLAKKMTKLEHHRSLFSTDANPNPSADMAGVIQARIAALRVMQKKPLSSPQEARSLAGKDLAESVVRKVFSDPANPAFRPFLDSRRLNALRAPHNQATAILCDGDILHVPFTAEEAEVLLKELNAEPKWFNFAEKLTQVVPFLPGRALSDLERFIALLPFFCTRRYTDLPLLRKVVAFDSQQTVKSVDAYRRSSTLHLLQSAQLGFVGGSKRFYADSMKRGFESLCTFPTIINRHIINHAKYTSTPGPPTDSKFSLLSSRHKSVVIGCAESSAYSLVIHRLEAKEDEKNVVMLYGHGRGAITELQWTSDGQYVVSCGYDKTVRLWDPEDGSQFNCLKLNAPAHGVIVSNRFPEMVCSRSFVPNQPDSELKVWNVKTNACVDLGDSHKFRGHVEQMDFTGPNGNLLIVATDGSQMSSYGEAVLWDWQSEKKLMSLTPHNGGLSVVESSPCGQFFATGGADRRVCLVDNRLKQPVVHHMFVPTQQTTAVSEMTSVSFSPCGSLIQAASTQNDVTVFDVRCSPYKAVARLRHKFATDGFTEATSLHDEETQGVYRTMWAPYGKVLATGGEDECVRFWDLTRSSTDANIKTLHSAGRCISSLDILYDGTAVCAGNDDNKVSLHTTPNATHLSFSNAHESDTLRETSRAIRGPDPTAN